MKRMVVIFSACSLLGGMSCSNSSSSPSPAPSEPSSTANEPAADRSGSASSAGGGSSGSRAECSPEALTKAFGSYSTTPNAAGEPNNVGPQHLCGGGYAIGMVGTAGMDQTVFLKASGSDWKVITWQATGNMCEGKSPAVPDFPKQLSQDYCDKWGPTSAG